MNLNEDIKKQLMSLAGMTDPSEFETFVRQLNPETPLPKTIKTKSPFQMHFVKMLALVESFGLDRIRDLDLQGQIEYVFGLISEDKELGDFESFFNKKPSRKSVDESKSLRDQGNKAYTKKDFGAAVKFYGQALMVAPIGEDGKGREAALAIGNR